MAINQGYVPKERYQEARDLDRFVQDLRCNLINQKLHPDEKNKKHIELMVDKELENKW